MLLRSCAVCLTVAVTDALWTYYTLAVGAHRALAAAWSSALIVLAGAFVWDAYRRDRRYALPAALGGFAGTYLTVRFG